MIGLFPRRIVTRLSQEISPRSRGTNWGKSKPTLFAISGTLARGQKVSTHFGVIKKAGRNPSCLSSGATTVRFMNVHRGADRFDLHRIKTAACQNPDLRLGGFFVSHQVFNLPQRFRSLGTVSFSGASGRPMGCTRNLASCCARAWRHPRATFDQADLNRQQRCRFASDNLLHPVLHLTRHIFFSKFAPE